MKIDVLGIKDGWLHILAFVDLEIQGRAIEDLVNIGIRHKFMNTSLEKKNWVVYYFQESGGEGSDL